MKMKREQDKYSDESLLAIYYVKVFYSKLLEILEVYCTSDLGIDNPELNFYYVKFSSAVNDVFHNAPELENLYSQKPELPDSLLGDVKGFDVYWECEFAPNGQEFYSKIESLFIQTGSKEFKLGKTINSFLKKADGAMQRHKNVVRDEMDKMLYGNVISCGSLRVNLKKATLQYKEHDPIEISPNTDEIQFLLFLMKKRRVIEYKEVAEWLDLSCYHPDYENEEYSREVQLIRKKLNPILEKAGMKREEINKMLIAKKNMGYKILPIN